MCTVGVCVWVSFSYVIQRIYVEPVSSTKEILSASHPNWYSKKRSISNGWVLSLLVKASFSPSVHFGAYSSHKQKTVMFGASISHVAFNVAARRHKIKMLLSIAERTQPFSTLWGGLWKAVLLQTSERRDEHSLYYYKVRKLFFRCRHFVCSFRCWETPNWNYYNWNLYTRNEFKLEILFVTFSFRITSYHRKA